MVDLWQMHGRTVLVTGASSGIGRAAAVTCSRLGARVVCAGRDGARLAETEGLLAGDGHRSTAFDLADTDGIPHWMKTLASDVGSLHGVAHCAGVQLTRPLRITAWEHVDALMRLNVGSAVALARGFRQKGVCAESGSLVFVSSVAGLVGEPGRAAYAASKSALFGLTRSLAVELARDAIRVNCVAPGVVHTPMWDETQRTLTRDQVAAIEAKHPLGFGEPEDVAHAIAFLLADSGRWITGSTLVVDGGFSAG